MGAGASEKPGAGPTARQVFLPDPAQASPAGTPVLCRARGILLLVAQAPGEVEEGTGPVYLPVIRGLVLEEKHVSLVSESFEPLGAQGWIFLFMSIVCRQ